MFDKLLVANRGEIAIRALRAAAELGIRTVAVHTHEDRGSLHRLKADEAYEIGEPGHPVRAYLDGDAIIALARRTRRRRDLPGLRVPVGERRVRGQLCRHRPDLHRTAPDVLRRAGDKTEARAIAAGAGLDVLAASEVVVDVAAAMTAAQHLGFPVFVKAAAGGGGRGLRRVATPDELPGVIETAAR